ncbi:MAG: tetratricopeptide repeat protein [Bacteroidetes bacterium]|nr:MAG: tetratricopeptide repeat protein [Bacteroidota bacterium]
MRYLLVAILLIGHAACGTAQQRYSTKSKKAISLFEEGQRIPNKNINPRTGLPDYAAGIQYMEKALAKDPNFWEAHLLAGEFSEYSGKNAEAIKHYEEAIRINPNHSPTGSTYFFLGNLKYVEGDYEGASQELRKYMSNRNANPKMVAKGRQILASCDFAVQAMKNPMAFNPINVGPGINTADPEYFPTITVDGKTILFTRRISDNRVPGNFKEQEDFYISHLSDKNSWMTAEAMPTNINTVNNEGAPTIAADGRTLIFVGCPDASGTDYGSDRTGRGSCDLFITKRIGSRWQNPKNLPGRINSMHWETQPSLSSDGKTIYFIRGIRGRSGSKSSDIYTATLQEDGTWGTPERLPDHINTPDQEESVLIHPDGRTLYFASRGHIGLGGSDLFVTRMDDDGNWSKPENLGYPINTKYDENSLMVSPDGEIAFFASDRDGGYGDLDIYYFELPEHLRPTKTLYFDGLVYDAKTRAPLAGKFQLIDVKTGKEIIRSESDKVTGEFMVSLPLNREYALNVSYPGYNFFSQNFNMTNPEGLESVHMDVPMIPVGEPDPVVLANVFFDLNKTTLRKESYVELNKLREFLEAHPKIRIELGGHTDTRGDANDNQKLSDGRAHSVMQYLIEQGIAKERLTAKGYGESQPVISDEAIEKMTSTKEKEAAHQKNRRTEYKIIGK